MLTGRLPDWAPTFFAIALAIVPQQFALATFDFMMVPLQHDFGLSLDQNNALQVVPTAGALFTVFVAGKLDDVFGSRTLLLGSAALFSAGAVLSASAQVFPMVVLGRTLEGLGGTSMSIASLALMGRTFNDHPFRGRLYGFYAAISSALFVVMPIVAAYVVGHTSWRAMPILWALSSGLVMAGAWFLLPPATGARLPLRALGLPLLGGAAVALACWGVMGAAGVGTPAQAERRIGLSLAAFAILAFLLLRRRTASPYTISPRWMLFVAGLLAQLLMRFIDLPFFTTILLQYRFGFSLHDSAWLMLPCQLASVVGGIVGGQMIDRHGARLAAIFSLVVTSAAAFATLFLQPQSPVWMAIVSVSLIGGANMSALAALTAYIMDGAASGREGSAAAFLNVAENVGIVVGGVVAGLAVFGTFESVFAYYLDHASALSPESAHAIAAQIRAGITFDRLVGRFELPPAELSALVSASGPAFAPAWTDAYRIAAAICLASNAVAALTLLRFRRS